MPDQALLPVSAPAELLRPLAPGLIVRLCDGSIGEVVSSTYAEVTVIQRDRMLGRGPWIFARCLVEPTIPGEASHYSARCAALAFGGRS